MRYTPEIDDRIRAAYSWPPRSRERIEALGRLAEELGVVVDCLRTRHNRLASMAGHEVRHRRPFSREEDAAIEAIGPRSSLKRWEALSERLNRSVSSLRHRRAYLVNERGRVQQPHRPRTRRPDRAARFRVPLPVSTPSWFEHQITRDRLMAGR